MKIERKNKENSNEDNLANDLLKIIEKKHWELLRIVNSGLTALFWDIGKEINKDFNENKNRTNFKSVIHFLSTNMLPIYGSFFTEKKIKEMQYFADQFADRSVAAQIAFLSTNSLRKKISADLIEQQKTLTNVFRKPYLSFFRPLLEPLKAQVALSGKNKRTPNRGEELFEILSGLIENFRLFQNRWLNTNLNLFFWEIGKRLNNEVLLNKKEGDVKSIFTNASVKLGNGFNEKHLREMKTFSEQFPDLNMATRISYMINWEHILALLHLKEMEAKFFYADLAANQGLSVAALKKQIRANVYEQISSAKKWEQSEIAAAFKNPEIIKKTKKRTKGSVVEIKTISLNIKNENFNSEIIKPFKNQYLSLLTG